MNSGLLILVIITYILSLAAALILAIASAKLSRPVLRKAIIFHFIIIAVAVPALLFYRNGISTPYMLLAGICSGLAISGWVLRTPQINKVLKIYFGMYLMSVLLFLISPSLLFFSISGKKGPIEKSYQLRDNYYLVEQLSTSIASQPPAWKVIRKYGIYNKTILRDIRFKSVPDSVRMIAVSNDTLILRTFHSSSGVSDSIENGFTPIIKRNTITQHN